MHKCQGTSALMQALPSGKAAAGHKPVHPPQYCYGGRALRPQFENVTWQKLFLDMRG